MTQNSGWPKAVTLDVAREVRRWRKKRDLTTEKLAERCAELGSPIHRSVLANLESGRRENVTVTDLVTLARALEVPAVLLLYPVGHADTVEVLPGQHVEPWAAYEWFIGNSTDPDAPRDEPQLGSESPIVLWYEHRLHDGLIPVIRDEIAAREGEDGDILRRQLDSEVRGLVRVRAELVGQGMKPPALHPVTAEVLGARA